MKNWWLRTCAHLQKNISKICDFHFFSFDLCTDIILKQLNKIQNLFFLVFFSLFIFLCCFPFFFPLCFPIVVPVALPRRWVEVLELTVEKIDDLGLVPIFKKYFKNMWFSFFLLRFMYRHYFKAIKLKKNLIFLVFFFTFHFSLLFPVFFPVVLPYCGPCCTTPSLGRSPRANRWKNCWLRTCAHLQKNISKICDFHFSPSIYVPTLF